MQPEKKGQDWAGLVTAGMIGCAIFILLEAFALWLFLETPTGMDGVLAFQILAIPVPMFLGFTSYRVLMRASK